jgi:hypothetical protein
MIVKYNLKYIVPTMQYISFILIISKLVINRSMLYVKKIRVVYNFFVHKAMRKIVIYDD